MLSTQQICFYIHISSCLNNCLTWSLGSTILLSWDMVTLASGLKRPKKHRGNILVHIEVYKGVLNIVARFVCFWKDDSTCEWVHIVWLWHTLMAICFGNTNLKYLTLGITACIKPLQICVLRKSQKNQGQKLRHWLNKYFVNTSHQSFDLIWFDLHQFPFET